MQVADINRTCQTKLFKDVLEDMIYSFRQSIINLTDSNLDMQLTKIRTQPIPYSSSDTKIEGKITNLVGGKISCVVGNNFKEFVIENLSHESSQPFEFFMEDVFDIFSNVAKNGVLEIGLTENANRWDKNMYFIQYSLKIILENGESLQSKLIVGVDEMTSLYFGD